MKVIADGREKDCPDGCMPSFVKSVSWSEGQDLRNAVLAEHVTIEKDEKYHCVAVTFDWLCRNCGQRHWATEFDSPKGLFSCVGIALKCGWSSIRMPWAVRTPERDKKSIYGVKQNARKTK
jgi:hypothetical protein